MPLRNGPHGYGRVTKTLHWSVFLLMAAQFVVGYVMDGDDHGRHRGSGGAGAAGASGVVLADHGSGGVDEGGDDGNGDNSGPGGGRRDNEEGDDDNPLLPVHIGLGLTIMTLGVVRIGWRATTLLPPWAPQLTRTDQRVAATTEKVLNALTLIVPATGTVLVLGDDDLLPLHVAAHIAFFAALAIHLGLVLRRRLLPRMLG